MRTRRIKNALSTVLIVALLFSVGCSKSGTTINSTPPSVTPSSGTTTSIPPAGGNAASTKTEGAIAYKHILNLANGMGARQDGTPAAAATVMYINGELRKMGYETEKQGFSVKVKRDGKFVDISSANVIAEKKGTGSKVLVVGAHYDSVDLGDGADDNASSIGVLLELASRLKDVDTSCTIRFIAFGDEEDGLSGSTYYVSTLKKDELNRIGNMINLDTLMSGNKLYVYGDFGKKGVLRDAALKAAKEMKIDLITQAGTKDYPAGTTGPFSDQVAFTEKGIPYTYFEATDWTLGEKDGYTQVDLQYGVNGEIWHTKYDTLEYINKTFPGRAESHLNAFVKVLMKIIPEYKP